MGQRRKAVSASSRSRRQRDVLGIIIRGRGVRYGAARQRELIAIAVRPRKWLEIGKHDRLLDQVKHTAVAGRCLAIHWLFLVCDISGSAREKKSLIANSVKVVRKHGGEIYEVGSGRCTTSRKALSEMISDAQDAVLCGRVPKPLNQLGRPRRDWTKEQQQIVWTEWFNRKHVTNEDAAAAASKSLKFGVTPNQMWHIVRAIRRERGNARATGASGRPWKHRE